MKTIPQALRFLLVLPLLTGVAYPVAVTGLSKILFVKPGIGYRFAAADAPDQL